MLLDISIAELQKDFIAESSNDLDAVAKHIATPNGIELSIFQPLRRAMLAIKGGAKFLELAEIEAICTTAANLFSQADELAQRKTLTSHQIINLFPALNEFITDLRKLIVNNETKNVGDPILAKLKSYLDSLKLELAKPQASTQESKLLAKPIDKSKDNPPAKNDVIYKNDVLAKAAAVGNEIITENEFFTLLDELRQAVDLEVMVETSPGTAPIVAEVALPVNKKPEVVVDEMLNNPILQQALVGEDFITESEFYALLDQLDRARKGGGTIEPALPVEPIIPDTPLQATPSPQVLSGQVVNLHKMAEALELIDEIVIESTDMDVNAIAVVTRVIKDIKTLVVDLQALQASMVDNSNKLTSLMSTVVNSLAVELGKNVVLEIHGDATTLPKTLIDQLFAPLLHLLRNAVDHGIELPAERVELQKPINGTVTVTISEHSQGYEITIADDGKGIELAKIKQSAVKNNLIAADKIDSLSDQECLQLIFKPGISSKAEVSNTSGRGVGMDVVMDRITELKGKIQVGSVPNKGTQFIISIPRPQAS